MLKKIQAFFESSFVSQGGGENSSERQLNLAAAALLIEMVFQDNTINRVEIEAVKNALKEQFALSHEEAEELYRLAEEEQNTATDYHQFTKLIAEHFTQPQKIKLIESLWAVAFADQVLDKYEENMVRRISDLIHISHKDFIQAKHRVAAKAS